MATLTSVTLWNLSDTSARFHALSNNDPTALNSLFAPGGISLGTNTTQNPPIPINLNGHGYVVVTATKQSAEPPNDAVPLAAAHHRCNQNTALLGVVAILFGAQGNYRMSLLVTEGP